MKNKNIILLSILFTFAACNGDSKEETTTPKNDHIWKSKTDSIKKAKDLAEQLNEQFKKKAEQMEKIKQ